MTVCKATQLIQCLLYYYKGTKKTYFDGNDEGKLKFHFYNSLAHSCLQRATCVDAMPPTPASLGGKETVLQGNTGLQILIPISVPVTALI